LGGTPPLSPGEGEGEVKGWSFISGEEAEERVSHEMLTAVVGVGIQNPHRRNVGSQLLTSLIIIFKLKG
jgi:hypothetical protein